MENKMIDVELVVNGESVRRSVNPKMSLLKFLREELGLKGTKDGCSTGDCGTCVVLVDGKPVDSCLYRVQRAHGLRVETVEGLASPDGTLHPLQAAFLESGGVQCGFCTPGMLMATKALLDTHPSPSEEEIRSGLEDVEETTGKVEVLRIIVAHDVGVAINSQQIEGQLIGSVAMGLGYALSENYPMKGGGLHTVTSPLDAWGSPTLGRPPPSGWRSLRIRSRRAPMGPRGYLRSPPSPSPRPS